MPDISTLKFDCFFKSNPFQTSQIMNYPHQNLNSTEHLHAANGEKPGLWVWVLALCCVVAIGVSGYLTFATLTSSKIAGCGGNSVFDCSHVTNSKWSTWLGIPVSAMAIGSYLALSVALIGALSLRSAWVKRFAWTAVATFAFSAGLAALWFTGLQVFVLKHLCSYCLVAHSCGIIAAVIAAWKIRQNAHLFKFASPLAAGAMVVLITGQVWQTEPEKFRIETFEVGPKITETFDVPFEAPFEAPGEMSEAPESEIFEAPVAANKKTYRSQLVNLIPVSQMIALTRPLTSMMAFTSPLQSGTANASSGSKSKTGGSANKGEATSKEKKPARRTVGINGGTIKLDVKQWPLNGSADAKHVFVEMMDYNCPNCRRTHKAISGAKEALEGDVAVVILPIPLNVDCNRAVTKTNPKFIESCDIAKLAIAVWRVDPAMFGKFHEAMFTNEHAPTLAEATQIANEMVDRDKLQGELNSGIPTKYIGAMVQLYERAGKGTVPKLMFPGTSIIGEFTSVESLVDVIKQQTK